MAVNKVEINGEVKLDLTQDTVTPETLLSGVTAHNAAGEEITGSGDFATKVEAQGYVTAHNQDATAHADIREAVSKAGKQFIINGTLGGGGKTVTVDKTRAEVKAAVQANRAVIVRMSFPETTDTYELPLRYRGPGDIYDTYIFCGVVVSTMTVATITYTDDAGASGEFEQEDLLSVGDTIPSPPGVASAGTSNKAARADHVHPSERPKAAQVILTVAGWDSGTKKQTVTVSGVLADTSKQVIWVTFASETALDAYMDAGIVPVAQGADTVTFRADKVPTADIAVTVLMQEVLT